MFFSSFTYERARGVNSNVRSSYIASPGSVPPFLAVWEWKLSIIWVFTPTVCLGSVLVLAWSSFLRTMASQRRCSCLHFIDEETVPKNLNTQRSNSIKKQSQDFNPVFALYWFSCVCVFPCWEFFRCARIIFKVVLKWSLTNRLRRANFLVTVVEECEL